MNAGSYKRAATIDFRHAIARRDFSAARQVIEYDMEGQHAESCTAELERARLAWIAIQVTRDPLQDGETPPLQWERMWRDWLATEKATREGSGS